MATTPEIELPASFGQLLRGCRTKVGATQEELADRAELSVRGIRYLESGLRRPTRGTVHRLVAALELPPADAERLQAAARRARSAAAGEFRPGAVPAPAGSLIGRERELDAVCSILRRHEVRVVTLTGPGGVGKTRLAIEAAARLRDAFPDGIVWVPLASVADVGAVPSAIGSALGMTEPGPLTPWVALRHALAERRTLLLLDNFERVTAAAADVATLVEGCAAVSVLLTSRVALRLRSGHEFAVAPLRLPDPGAPPSVHAVAVNPAVDLFLRRAQAAGSGLALTSGNAAAVAAICRRLEGLPLALELAAARVPALPPQAMVERLQRRLPLLVGGPADSPARQRTMREAIAWSHDLLAPDSRRLFRRLAVFEGGCTLATAEAVCPSPSGPSSDVLGLVEDLQRNSLLQVEDSADDDPRIRMLETIREFAADLLAASGEADRLGHRHTLYYLSLAERAAGGLYGPDTALWLNRLEREHDNLRAALRRCIDRRDARIGLRLGAALWSYWYVRGYVAEGRSHLALLLTLPGADADPAARARALLGAGQLALTQADHAAARSALSESVALHRANGDARGLAEALLAAGFAARLEEDYAGADPLLHEALALGRGIGHTFVTAASLHHLGLMAVDVRGDLAQARSLLDESLSLYSALRLPRFVALLLLALGDLARAAGDTARARDLLARGLSMLRDVGEGLGLHGALDAVAQLASVEGRTARAVRLAAAADRLRIAGGTQAWPVVERARARWLASARTSLGQVGFDGAWREGAALSPGEAVAVALDERD